LVQPLVAQVVEQVRALVVYRAPHLVVALLVLAARCVLRLQAALVLAAQVLVRVVQAALVLRSVAALVQVVRVQVLVLVAQVPAVLVVQVAVVLVVQVAVNVAHQKRNLVHVVVKTSTKCCRKLLRVTQQAMPRFQKASSLLNADHLHKSLLQN
jgi:hypothetical protein